MFPVKLGKSHVRRADLYGEEIISESALRGDRKDEEDHDGTVHGDQREILLGRHDPAGDERARAGPANQMESHQQREHDAQDNGSER